MAIAVYSLVGPHPQARFHLCDTQAELPSGLDFNNFEGDLAYTKDNDKVWKSTGAGSWIEIGAGGVGAHATTHAAGGSDPLKLDDLAAPDDNVDLDASTTKHGLMKKYPGGTTNFLRADGAFAAPTAEAAVVLTTVEKSIGAIARRDGKFQITGLAGLTPGKAVLIRQAVGPYTGKGTRADEAEMDGLTVRGKVFDATTIDAYWSSPTKVRGNFKFDYLVSA